jgi:hypothetical protein
MALFTAPAVRGRPSPHGEKEDGGWRPCGDFRRLNLVTTPDSYPLPNIMDFAVKMAGCSVFSKIDLRKGYHQIPVHPSDVPKTAITTPFGLFEYLRMPFSLRNAGNTFQRMMDRILAGLDFCFWYLDDVIVASPSHQQHLLHLEQLFTHLQAHGLVINLEKFSFAASNVTFLGHEVSAAGAKPLQSHVEAIDSFPLPGTFKQLQAFLGLVNFYRLSCRGRLEFSSR